jgi:hypothetical protein
LRVHCRSDLITRPLGTLSYPRHLIGLTPYSNGNGQTRQKITAGNNEGSALSPSNAPVFWSNISHRLVVPGFQMAPKPLDVMISLRFPSGKSKIHRPYVTPGAELNAGVFGHMMCTSVITKFESPKRKYFRRRPSPVIWPRVATPTSAPIETPKCAIRSAQRVAGAPIGSDQAILSPLVNPCAQELTSFVLRQTLQGVKDNEKQTGP